MIDIKLELLQAVIVLAKHAGEQILTLYYDKNIIPLDPKSDQSPVTNADLLCHTLLQQGLLQLTPHLPILSEEAIDQHLWPTGDYAEYWSIDPIDGTREFMMHNDEFTVNIALIQQQRPVLGVVYAPALHLCYFAGAGLGAWKQHGSDTPIAIHTASYNAAKALRIVASRHHHHAALPSLLQRCHFHELLSVGSSLKFCLVADGSADLYPRFGPTAEWDTAAAQCIVEQAGGIVVDTQGKPLHYQMNNNFLNPPFMAMGDQQPTHRDYLLQLMQNSLLQHELP